MRKGFTLKGFTLIELLVVISIIGLLLGLSVFGLQGARLSARDAKRKTDLEQIRSGLEMYKADCNSYPLAITGGSPLMGAAGIAGCSGNTYILSVPIDPLSPSRAYAYSSPGTVYSLCAALEQAPSAMGPGPACGDCKASTGCNYRVTNP